MRRPGNNSFEMPEFIQSHSMRVPVSLRPLTGADYDEWNEVRWRNDAWLKPWESGDPLHGAPITYKEWMKQLRRNERAGTGAVFAIEQHGRIVGQISLGAICYGAMRSGVVGYWVDERCAGRGYAPMPVALLADWAMFDPTGPRLHRMEIDVGGLGHVRPDRTSTASHGNRHFAGKQAVPCRRTQGRSNVGGGTARVYVRQRPMARS